MASKAIDLEQLASQARTGLSTALDEAALEAWRIEYLGRKGRLTGLLRTLSDLPIEERKRVGAEANVLKQQLEAAFEMKRDALAGQALAETVEQGWLDVTLPGRPKKIGRLHPVTQTLRDMLAIFQRMGF